jgi:hypothetical protein
MRLSLFMMGWWRLDYLITKIFFKGRFNERPFFGLTLMFLLSYDFEFKDLSIFRQFNFKIIGISALAR